MKLFLCNIFLAAVWAFAMGQLSAMNFIIGFALGYAALWWGREVFGSAKYCARLPRLLELLAYFLWQVFQANLRVARDVITPGYRMRPGIIALPLDAETDEEITILANMIALTPGTLGLLVSRDRRVLYVHSMYIDDVEQEKQNIKAGFERRLLEVMR